MALTPTEPMDRGLILPGDGDDFMTETAVVIGKARLLNAASAWVGRGVARSR